MTELFQPRRAKLGYLHTISYRSFIEGYSWVVLILQYVLPPKWQFASVLEKVLRHEELDNRQLEILEFTAVVETKALGRALEDFFLFFFFF